MTNFVFLAISRTGADPNWHEVVEVAAILRRPGQGDVTRYWHIRPENLEHASADELRRNRYLERRESWEHNGEPVVKIDPTLGTTTPTSRRGVASRLAGALLESYAVTLGNDREIEFLREFLRRNGHPCPLMGQIDVTSFAAGAMAGYAQGWAACYDSHPTEGGIGARIDLGPLELPFGPMGIARAMGLHVPDQPESALARAQLAGALWAAASATPTPPLVRSEPVDAGPSTGPTLPVDAELDVLVASRRPHEQAEARAGREPYQAATADTLAMPAPTP
ncbi:hypothetical protein [Nonomuraea sp. NEAU-A123]|uniref:hypothetical protein n=1 Tax=Nonomuraea sp. NEAU-A123 TaxID=2839649 RepID=UPI001BE4C155|nr:hypothetical protein [Nonomuraea sp. NEAU-A123]MBT2226294.1 hypothetical protein [Nonomuraea sp. NEAU-A123]